MLFPRPILALSLLPASLHAAEPAPEITWKTLHADTTFRAEGGAIGDINGDGKPDVVYGAYWFEGPDFVKKHEYRPVEEFSPRGYSNNFFTFADDFNGDGKCDIMIYGLPGEAAFWFENPGDLSAHWPKHQILDIVDNESPSWDDITGDGKKEIICAQNGFHGYASPGEDPTKPWTFHPITEHDGSVQRYTHGLGIGDVDGDGRTDLLEKHWWWRQPDEGPEKTPWIKNRFQLEARGGAQMFTYDFNEDGHNDILTVIDAHGYGLCWFEQLKDDSGSTWKKHRIITEKPEESVGGAAVTQMHAVELIDMDGDGIKDIVTGKRYWAHVPNEDGTGGDPGGNEAAVLFWLKTIRGENGVSFEYHAVHNDSGVGTQLPVGDLNGDGLPDIVTCNKKGLFIHFQSR